MGSGVVEFDPDGLAAGPVFASGVQKLMARVGVPIQQACDALDSTPPRVVGLWIEPYLELIFEDRIVFRDAITEPGY